ncbi:MAG: DUF2490 domain-containing protein [Gemmatimonadaceae bacterium]|nr:DUF2490 domain-containing protein [Gemmatimonadaceae bacterium]
MTDCYTGGARLVAILGSLIVAVTGQAQSTWRTVHQPSSWYGVFVDEPVSKRTAVVFDGQWRRMGLGDRPQQLLLRPGVLRTLAPGVRVGGGYAYIATAPYGEAPSATPLREHRIWQQLLLTHTSGPLAMTHRYRLEQRWLAPVQTNLGAGSETVGRFAYQQRLRYMLRAQGALPTLRVGGRRIVGFAWDEILMPVGHADASARLGQNRAAVGVGVPITPRQRLDIGYMNLWNPLGGARVNEINHTLTLSWIWTGR